METTKQRIKEILKEEIDSAINEQRPPLPPPPPRRPAQKPARKLPPPPPRSKASKSARRPPPPPKKTQGSADVKTFDRFTKLVHKVIVRGLGSEASERDILEALIYFMNEAGARIPRGGRNPEKSIRNWFDSTDQDVTKVLRTTFVKATKGIKAYKQQMRKR